MLTPVIVHLIILCFHSTRGLTEVPRNIIAISEVLGEFSDHLIARNDSKLKEFTDIFNHYVNLTLSEKANRAIVKTLVTRNATKDYENQDVNGSIEWQNALHDILDEDNLTVEFNKTLEDHVIEYIETFAYNPELLKEQSENKYRRLETTHDTVPNESEYNDTYDPEADDRIDKRVDEPVAEEYEYLDIPLTRRIFGSNLTKIKKFPFIASVQVMNKFQCAGSIIKDDLVITAASCLQLAHNNRFFRENPNFVSIRVGSVYANVGGEVVLTTDIYFYPSYDPVTLRHNLAVMRLRKVLNFRRRHVKKIEFHRGAHALPENTRPITIVGWGARTENNILYFPPRLHVARLDYYDQITCKEVYGKKFVTKTNFCAGFFSRGDGACNHDVGDPGITGRFLRGVTSFGSPKCGRPDTPTVFTILGFYTDWIEEIMEQDVPQLKFKTSTDRAYRVYSKPIKLYGIPNEDEPIPLIREGAAQGLETEPIEPDANTKQVDADIKLVLRELKRITENDTDNIGDNPFVELDPEIIPKLDEDNPNERFSVQNLVDVSTESENTLREEARDNKESAEVEPQEEYMKQLWSDESDGAGDRVTKITNFGQAEARWDSREARKSDKIDSVRITSAPEMAVDLGFGINVAAETPVTERNDVNPKESVSRETQENVKENLDYTSIEKELNPDDKNNYYVYRKTPTDTKEDVGLRIPSDVQTVRDTKNENQDNNQKQREYVDDKTSYEYEGMSPTELENADNNGDHDENNEETPIQREGMKESKHKEESKEAIQNHGETQSKLGSDNADDVVKREIQKLISQLDINSKPVSAKNHKSTNAISNKGTATETVLTLLYLTDNEKKIFRAQADSAGLQEEGLSIDVRPFQNNKLLQKNIAGNSEIYEIFQRVLSTVVNKTLT